MTTVSFNTTNVLNLDSIGKLYRIDVPLSEGTGPGEALVYSTASITNGKAAPASAIYLKMTILKSHTFPLIAQVIRV